MVQQLEVSPGLRTTLAGAYGGALGRSREAPVVGTEHLLIGIVYATGTGPAARALAAAQLTPSVVMAVLRKHSWHSDDSAGDDGQGHLGALDEYPPRKPTAYSGAARAALHRAIAIAAQQGETEIDNEHLLQGLLAVHDNRAVELLRACRVEPAQLSQERGPTATEEDPVSPELRPTRDALLGNAGYHSHSVSSRLASGIMRLFAANLAEMPVHWAELDARDQARRLGARRTGTEHLILAIVAIHETLRSYPHMRPDDAGHRHVGGQVLADAGVTYQDARDTVRQHSDQLGSDARPASSYTRRLRRHGTSVGTGQLLLEILTQDDSRGANLLRRTGVPPGQLRTQLRASTGLGGEGEPPRPPSR